MVLVGLGVRHALAAASSKVGVSTALDMTKWEALLNQSFRLWLSSRTSLVLTLVKVHERPALSNALPKLDQFSLTFAGAITEQIAEGTYEMNAITTPNDSNFYLHLLPAGTDASRVFYRSDFNLLT